MFSGNEGLTVTFDDDEGVTLKSDKNINLTATNEIIFKTETNVKIKAISKVTAKKENGQGEISLENDMYCHRDIAIEILSMKMEVAQKFMEHVPRICWIQ